VNREELRSGDVVVVDFPDPLLEKWQRLTDLMAQVMDVPAGLIMRVRGDRIEVLVSSQTADNPYHPGDNEHLWNSGLYCETVIRSRRELEVPDALADADWKDNPDVKLNMICYLGYPILTPSGEVFGTLCILDSEARRYSPLQKELMVQFKELLESHLALFLANRELRDQVEQLSDLLAEVKTLRGIIPICSYCKKMRTDEGFWDSVEHYIATRSEAGFTHSICPECMEKHFPKE